VAHLAPSILLTGKTQANLFVLHVFSASVFDGSAITRWL